MDGTTKAPGGGGTAAVPDAAPTGALDIRDEDPVEDSTEDFDAWLRSYWPRPKVRLFGQTVQAPPVVSVRAAATWADIVARRREELITVDTLRGFVDDLYADDTLAQRLYQGGADNDAFLALIIWGMRNGRGENVPMADVYRAIADPSGAGGAAGEAETRGGTSDAIG
jgi:hypothetical protein